MARAKPRLVVRTKLPAFRQLCAIVRQVITEHPTDSEADLKEAIKLRHVSLGFRYSNDQIPRAMDAVETAMRRYTLTPAQIAAHRTRRALPEMAQQPDPPWRAIRREEDTAWTSLRELGTRYTKGHSGPLT